MKTSEDTFIVISFPENQELMEFKGFQDNSVLINDEPLYTEFGDSAYLIRTSWLKENKIL